MGLSPSIRFLQCQVFDSWIGWMELIIPDHILNSKNSGGKSVSNRCKRKESYYITLDCICHATDLTSRLALHILNLKVIRWEHRTRQWHNPCAQAKAMSCSNHFTNWSLTRAPFHVISHTLLPSSPCAFDHALLRISLNFGASWPYFFLLSHSFCLGFFLFFSFLWVTYASTNSFI